MLQLSVGIRLCARYAMSGTEMAYDDILLCACYALSATEIAWDATRGKREKLRNPRYLAPT
eukprot:3121366-Rhodomonas_salina.5